MRSSNENSENKLEDKKEADSLYSATTSVVRAVTCLSKHSQNPIEMNYALLLKTDIMKITEEVEKLYVEVDLARTVITSSSHGQVKFLFNI